MSRGTPVAVVDGSNVAHDEQSESRRPKLSNLTRMHDTLVSCGFRPITIVDATLRHTIDDQEKLEKLIEAGSIRQAPAGTPADFFVLETAEREGGIIISNDTYRQWRDGRDWLDHRRVPFMVIDGNVELYWQSIAPELRPEEAKRGADEPAPPAGT
jgi:hypothetical protein